MTTKVVKWGNSLALRIPKSFADDMGLGMESQVELRIEKGKLILIPKKKKKHTLKDLVSMINEGNLHHEIDAGIPVGREIW